METGGTLVIGTGNDDLRAGSKAIVQIVARSGVVFEQDVAAGARFADRTNFTHDFTLTTPTDLTEIQRIEVQFVPDHRDFMNDDQWWFERLTVTVTDGTSTTTLFDQTVHHKFEAGDTWSSGTLPTYAPLVSTTVSTGTLTVGTGDD